MAFTFQINNDVKFKHDEKLLAKAEGFRPEIKKERIHPARIVEEIEDPLSFLISIVIKWCWRNRK